MKKSINYIIFTTLGIILYVALSMTVKIPIVSQLHLNLEYIILTFICYYLGSFPGMIVGGVGYFISACLLKEQFLIGGIITNVIIGQLCGFYYSDKNDPLSYICNFIAVPIFIVFFFSLIKTIIDHCVYLVPVNVIAIENAFSSITTALIMLISLHIAMFVQKEE